MFKRSANTDSIISKLGIKKNGNTPNNMAKVILNASFTGDMPLVNEVVTRCFMVANNLPVAYMVSVLYNANLAFG